MGCGLWGAHGLTGTPGTVAMVAFVFRHFYVLDEKG